MKTEHDSFLAFYLTEDDESAVSFKETRFALPPYEVAENQQVVLASEFGKDMLMTSTQETTFRFVRDYETVKVEQEVPNEFLLVIYDGDSEFDLDRDHKLPHREKGAYYKNIERKMHLKKKRVNVSNLVFMPLVQHAQQRFFRPTTSTKINGKLSEYCMHP